jgi:acetyl-CoA C-acetyltransferase
VAIKGALEKAGISGDQVDYVIMGQVIQAGTGQITARQAANNAGIPMNVPATTINNVCLSGLNAIYLADLMIQAGQADIVVAGGMESMTNAPYLLPGARGGLRLGHGEVVDSILRDGLLDAYDEQHMGSCAEWCARTYAFTREDQDAYAVRSYRRAQDAIASGLTAREIVPVEVPGRRGGVTVVDTDEGPGRADFDKLRTLRPAFQADGTITAGNASSLNDGAAALVLVDEATAAERGWPVRARILASSVHAQLPAEYTTAPIGAMRALYAKLGWTPADVDLYEINEAFSVVPMAAMRAFDLDPERVNVLGGAVSLGHPIGVSGARILVTLINALEARGGRRGMASICIGGGEALALALETA